LLPGEQQPQWFYARDNQRHGPVSLETVQHLLAARALTRDSLVWREGMVNWLPKSAVPELQASLNIYAGPSAHYPGMATMAPNSGLAIASMICGIVSILLCYVNALAAIPAVICGHMALKKISRSEQPMAGRGMAIAGLVTGYIGLLIQISFICFISWMFFAVRSSSSRSSFAPPVPMTAPVSPPSPSP
jgi:hypothetical protein